MPRQNTETKHIYNRLYREANKERMKALDHAKYERNKEKRKAQARAYYDAHKQQVLEYKRQHWHENKEEMHARRRTYNIDQERRRATQLAWFREHADHLRAYRQQHYQEHREQAIAANRANYAKNPQRHQEYRRARRARILGAPRNDLTPQQWEDIKAAYDHRCVYCSRKMARLTQDHIVPLSKGGNHTVQNVVPACRSCNSRKGNRAPLKPVQPLLFA